MSTNEHLWSLNANTLLDVIKILEESKYLGYMIYIINQNILCKKYLEKIIGEVRKLIAILHYVL